MIDGVLLLDKPSGKSTSFCARLLGKACKCKAGHAGTLDPFATGLVTVLLGSATKLSPFLTNFDKTYTGEVRLGVKTSTGDCEGEVIEECADLPSEAEIREIVGSLLGRVELMVPAFSAVKKDGKRLYKYARDGHSVELPRRTVEIATLDIDDVHLPRFRFTATVSKGTYIRALAEKIGEMAGCGAHLTELRRVRVGNFRIETALPMHIAMELAESGKLCGKVLSPADALPFPEVELSRDTAREIALGRFPKLDVDNLADGDIFYVSYSTKLIAILRKQHNNGTAFEFIRVFVRPDEIEN